MLVTSWDITGQCISTVAMRFSLFDMQVQQPPTLSLAMLLPACQVSTHKQPRHYPVSSLTSPPHPQYQQLDRCLKYSARILVIVLAAQM